METHRAGDEEQEERGDDGAQELGDPVEEATEESDVSAEEDAEGDSGVDVAAGDVGPRGDGNEQGEAVGEGRRHQPRRSRRSGASQLSCARSRRRTKGISEGCT